MAFPSLFSVSVVHFSEKPPSLERLLARLFWSTEARKESAFKEEWVEPSPPRLLPELLRLDLDLEEGRPPPEDSWGVWTSILNRAVAVTFVTWPDGEEQREEPLLVLLAGTVVVSTVMCGSRKTLVPPLREECTELGSCCWSREPMLLVLF